MRGDLTTVKSAPPPPHLPFPLTPLLPTSTTRPGPPLPKDLLPGEACIALRGVASASAPSTAGEAAVPPPGVAATPDGRRHASTATHSRLLNQEQHSKAAAGRLGGRGRACANAQAFGPGLLTGKRLLVRFHGPAPSQRGATREDRACRSGCVCSPLNMFAPSAHGL